MYIYAYNAYLNTYTNTLIYLHTYMYKHIHKYAHNIFKLLSGYVRQQASTVIKYFI